MTGDDQQENGPAPPRAGPSASQGAAGAHAGGQADGPRYTTVQRVKMPMLCPPEILCVVNDRCIDYLLSVGCGKEGWRPCVQFFFCLKDMEIRVHTHTQGTFMTSGGTEIQSTGGTAV